MAYLAPLETVREYSLTPDEITAESYQLGAATQMITDRDPDGTALATIGGIPVKPRIYMGAQEEFLETIEPDANHPPYNRLHRLILPGTVEYIFGSPEADLYHAKEFGDLAWYSTTALSLYDLRLAGTLTASMTDVRIADVDELAQVHAREMHGGAAWEHSGQGYITSASAFLEAFDVLLRYERSDTSPDVMDDLRNRLSNTAGEMFVAMSVVLQSRLQTTLADVLSDNNAKIERRIRENTVFGPGGDKR